MAKCKGYGDKEGSCQGEGKEQNGGLCDNCHSTQEFDQNQENNEGAGGGNEGGSGGSGQQLLGRCGGCSNVFPGLADGDLCQECSSKQEKPESEEEPVTNPPAPEELADQQLDAGLKDVAGVKPGEKPNEAQQQYMDYLAGIADEKGADGRSARDEMVMNNEDAQADAAERYQDFKQQNPEATMDDFYQHNNQELANQEASKANAALADYQDEAHQMGGDQAKIDQAEKANEQGEDSSDDFRGKEFSGQDNFGMQTGDKNKDDKKDDAGAEGKEKDEKKEIKGKEQNDGKKAGGGKPQIGAPKEGWFKWLEKTWPKAIKNPALAAPCKKINLAIQKAITASLYGNVVRALPTQPSFNIDPVGSIFDALKKLEDPLIYTSGIMVTVGPFLGLPVVFLYSGIQPVQIFRNVIDTILKHPILNTLLIALKTAVDEIMKGTGQGGDNKPAPKPAAKPA